MLEAKDAFQTLGVKDGASREEIEKKYNILLKRYRASRLEGQEQENIDINAVNEAYNLLMGVESPAEDKPEGDRLVFKKLGINEKKAKNFFYYYKFHMLAAVLLILFLGSIIRGWVTYVKPDLSVAFIGEFYIETNNGIRDKVMESMPELKAVGINTVILMDKSTIGQDNTLKMKAITLVVTGDVDLFILDKKNFEDFAKQGAFENLDSLAEQLNIDRTKNKEYIIGSPDDGVHLYGISVDDSRFFKDLKVEGKEKIVAIRKEAKHYNNAVTLLKKLLEK